MIGAEAHGIDLAPNMVDYCRRTLPEADVRLGNAAALYECVDGEFDAVVAPDNLIDVFDDAERRQVLADVRDVLAPGGLFIFSSHDLGWAETNPGPRDFEARSLGGELHKLIAKSPAELIQGVRSRRQRARNRKRLGPLQQFNADHAIINDFPHDYSLLHYYIRRDDDRCASSRSSATSSSSVSAPTVARSGLAAPARRTVCITSRARSRPTQSCQSLRPCLCLAPSAVGSSAGKPPCD